MPGQLSAERNIQRAEIVTTDATATTLKRIPIALGKTLRIHALVTARRFAGASGSAGDSASYTLEATYKNVDGTVSIVGSLESLANEDQVGWTATLTTSGINVIVQVTGAASNSVRWITTVDVQNMS